MIKTNIPSKIIVVSSFHFFIIRNSTKNFTAEIVYTILHRGFIRIWRISPNIFSTTIFLLELISVWGGEGGLWLVGGASGKKSSKKVSQGDVLWGKERDFSNIAWMEAWLVVGNYDCLVYFTLVSQCKEKFRYYNLNDHDPFDIRSW